MDNLKVAAVCMTAVPGEVEKNLARMQTFVLNASAEGADIICFPELSVTGYPLKQIDGIYKEFDYRRVLDRIIRMAKDAQMVIIAGLIEISEGQAPYITQAAAGPKGLIGHHRKTHLSPTEQGSYQAGREIETFFHKNTNFGIQLCYESHFPEISTIMALMGAHIIFLPHASPRGAPEQKFKSWLRHLPARAYDNGVFLVACNQVGKPSNGFSFPGVAIVIGPDGHVISSYRGNEEKILFAELKAESLRNIRQHKMKYFLPQRRSELIKKYVLNTNYPDSPVAKR